MTRSSVILFPFNSNLGVFDGAVHEIDLLHVEAGHRCSFDTSVYIYIYVVHVMFRLFLSVTISYDAEIISVTYARKIGITINDDS